jgi:hypothetical protein
MIQLCRKDLMSIGMSPSGETGIFSPLKASKACHGPGKPAFAPSKRTLPAVRGASSLKLAMMSSASPGYT